MMKATPLAVLLAVLASVPASTAKACEDPYGACADVDPLWTGARHGTFAWLPDIDQLSPGTVAFRAGVGHADAPLTLRVPSPAAGGREIGVVDSVDRLDVGAAVGLPLGLELSVALPVMVQIAGAGSASLTDVASEPTTWSGLGRPSVGVASPTVFRRRGSLVMRGRFFLDVASPAPTPGEFAGDGSAVVAPAIDGQFEFGRARLSLRLGARLGRLDVIADQQVGSLLVTAAGGAVTVIPDWLNLGAEAVAMPRLGTATTSAAPVEWLASASSPLAGLATVFIGAGTGLPPGGAAPTTAAWRVLGSVTFRYPVPGRAGRQNTR